MTTATENDAVVKQEDPLSQDPFINPDRSQPPGYTERRFDYDIVSFIRKEHFLGLVLTEVTRALDYKSPACGYIGPRKIDKLWSFFMAYCPWRMALLTEAERHGVFMHEVYHFILGHLTTRTSTDPKTRRLHNMAMDLANNSLIHHQVSLNSNTDKNIILPKGYALIPGVVPKGCKTPQEEEFYRKLPPLQTAEWYLKQLLDFQEKNGGGGDDEMNMVFSGVVSGLDDHGVWEQVPPEIQDLLRQKARGILERSTRKADQSNSWGSVPQWMIEELRRMASGEIDWRSVLRNFLATIRSPHRDSTVKRINKKAPYLFPGAKRQNERTLVCFIDQSGSMGDQDISLLFAELSSLANLAPIDVYHFDTEVDENSRSTWTRQNPYPKTLRTRCGGTDFDCVARFINEKKTRNQKWSGVLILTDGYAPTMGEIAHGKVLWIITPGGSMNSVRTGDLVIKMTGDKESGEATARIKL